MYPSTTAFFSVAGTVMLNSFSQEVKTIPRQKNNNITLEYMIRFKFKEDRTCQSNSDRAFIMVNFNSNS
jgi:hypothetical protein